MNNTLRDAIAKIVKQELINLLRSDFQIQEELKFIAVEQKDIQRKSSDYYVNRIIEELRKELE